VGIYTGCVPLCGGGGGTGWSWSLGGLQHPQGHGLRLDDPLPLCGYRLSHSGAALRIRELHAEGVKFPRQHVIGGRRGGIVAALYRRIETLESK
jgi:hypothetical protein